MVCTKKMEIGVTYSSMRRSEIGRNPASGAWRSALGARPGDHSCGQCKVHSDVDDGDTQVRRFSLLEDSLTRLCLKF